MAKKEDKAQVADAAPDAASVPAVVQSAPLPVPEDTIDASELIADAKESAEHLTRDDLMIPFVSVLQTGSPQVKKGKSEFIEQARPGMFFNTLTRDLFDGEKGIIVLPVFYTINYSEWKPRNAGGGLVRDHGTDESILKQCKRNETTGRDTLPNGHEIATSGMHYCYLLDPNQGYLPSQAVISLSATQLKKSRRWNTLVSTLKVPHPSGRGHFTPARFYQTYKLTTVLEGNDKGDWFGVNIDYNAPVLSLPGGADLYRTAKEFSKLAAEGKVKVAPQTESTAGVDSGAGGAGSMSDDIPF